MRQREKGEVDLAGRGRVVGPERAIPVRQLGMNLAQNPAGMGVGTEIDQVEAVVTVDQLDQLTAGIPGSTKNRRADAHEIAKYTHMRIERSGGWWVRWVRVRGSRLKRQASDFELGSAAS